MIFKTTNGQQQPLKRGEAKRIIMKANNWTADQYRKQYDLFKNKLRNYESYRSAKGAAVAKQSPLEVLYKQAKAKIREGADYKPSAQMRNIQSFAAHSISKGRKVYKSAKYTAKIDAEYRARITGSYEKMIDANSIAKELAAKIDDPVKLEKALADLADALREKQKDDAAAAEASGIPAGETSGSDPADLDFDVDDYI